MQTTTLPQQTTIATPLEGITLEQIRQAIIELCQLHPADSTRIQRGARLLATATPTRFEAVEGIWFVASEEGETEYVVNLKLAPALACTCPDSSKRGMACKHRWAVIVLLRCCGCDALTALRTGTVPMCRPCQARETTVDAQPRCKTCHQSAALSYGVCGACAILQVCQD